MTALSAASVLLLTTLSVEAVPGLVVDGSGMVVKNSDGQCWRTNWMVEKEKATVECDGDDDGDMVPNPIDQCPDTPKGDEVDAKGCSLPKAPPPDSDGDGIDDAKDRCPGTPRGAAVDSHGCEFDSDGDGVVDSMDRCGDTPKGAKVDAYGCELDSDGDGVVDSKDRCPGTIAGAEVDESGCMTKVSLDTITFDLNSSILTSSAKKVLDMVASRIHNLQGVSGIIVTGHTDSYGTESYNQMLSEKRAKRVGDYLVTKGVNAKLISTRGKGENSPVAANDTRPNRAKNRRVEFEINK
ncbi:MAG: OmpA family protein [Gammaproteobacteria bacterium]|nr:OmpA family protein [Gammaproteobacteria bacterium]